MKVDSPTVLGIATVTILCIFAVSMTVFSNNIYSIEATDSPSKNNLERDAKVLAEINRQAILSQKNGDEKKFREQMTLMQEKQKEFASRYLGVDIAEVYITEGFNFPFRDASEIKPIDPQSQAPICDIASKVPTQLLQIRDSDMFLMFMEKYSHYPITFEMSDERRHISMVHYSLIATSENEKLTGSTYFHVDSCTNQISGNYYNLHCRNTTNDDFTHTNHKDDVITSLKDDKFCTIYLEPWKQDLLNYSKSISEERRKHFDKLDTIKEDPNFDAVMEFNFELDRFVMLGNLIDTAMDGDFEGKKLQEMMRKYTEKYGNLPDEFLTLIDVDK